MITIIAGGKKNTDWLIEACEEYEKRLRKPFAIEWEFIEEEKLLKKLSNWPFTGREFVICCDERGENISSREYSQRLELAFSSGKDVIILIGGAYGFNDEIRARADMVWSFSKLVFPHKIARLVVVEQIYRATQILAGRPYHHD